MMDVEMAALSEIVDRLETLESGARERVISYLQGRYRTTPLDRLLARATQDFGNDTVSQKSGRVGMGIAFTSTSR